MTTGTRFPSLGRRLALGAALLVALGGCSSTSSSGPTRVPTPPDLLPLVSAGNPYLSRTVMLIAQTGDQATVSMAGDRLVALAIQVVDDPTVSDGFRQRTLSEIYSAMVAVPTPNVMAHCRAISGDLGRAPWHQAMVTAVLVAQADAVPPRPSLTPDPAPVMTPPTSAVIVGKPDADQDANGDTRIGIRPPEEGAAPVAD